MAILWKDFPSGAQGLYGTNSSLLTDGPYAVRSESILVEDPDPSVSDGVVLQLQTPTGTGTALRKVLPTTTTTVGFAFRIWLPELPATQSMCLAAGNGSDQDLFSVSVGPAGQIYLRTGSGSGTIVAESAINVIVTNAWQHIEGNVTIGASGTAEIRVEGVEKLNATGINTEGNPGPAAMVSFKKFNSASNTMRIKDFILRDASGGWADTFLGTLNVIDLGPTADVSSGWSRTTGTSDFAILDNVPPVDSDYIYAEEDPSIPAPSIVEFANLPEDVTSVISLMSIIRGRKSDGGDANVQVSFLSGGDADNGEDRPMTTAFTYWWDISHLDPDTSTQWSPAGVDAATLQINRTI